MVPIRKNLVDQSKYNIKCPYEMEAQKIVVHETANDASANNEISYMKNNNLEKSFHYAVDDVEIVQGIPEDRNAWHAGDGDKGKGNREGLAIEICYSKSGGERWKKAVNNAAEFIAKLLKERKWGIDKVTKHQDYSGKNCPHRILGDYGWDNFLKLVKEYLEGKKELYRVAKEYKNGKFIGQIGAFQNKENAINMCKANKGTHVFDSKGNIVFSNVEEVKPQPAPKPQPKPQPKPTENKPKVIYQTYAGGKWLGEITEYNETNSNGYAGIYGKNISGLRVKLSNGKTIRVRSHLKGRARNNWLGEVTKWDNSSNGYSGIIGLPIDCISIGADGYKLRYRVHIQGGKWLDWVTNYNINDYNNGVAGIYGKTIDAIQIDIL